MLNPYKFPKENIIGLDEAYVSRSGDTMTGSLVVESGEPVLLKTYTPDDFPSDRPVSTGANIGVRTWNGYNTTIAMGYGLIDRESDYASYQYYLVDIDATAVNADEPSEKVRTKETVILGRNIEHYVQTTFSATFTPSSYIKIYGIAGAIISGTDIKDGRGNVLNDKQNKTLSTPIVVDGTSYTTVETAMNAINNSSSSSGITLFADEFSSDASYAVGDHVTYDGGFYRCITPHTGAWDATHFTAVTVGEELSDKVDESLIGVASGVAGLDANGLVPISQLPDVSTKIKAFINESLGMTYHGYNVWTDGTDIYMSTSNTHKVLNRTTMQWESKTWTGLTNFNGQDIWTDGTKIYYSGSNVQYVLDVATSTWTSVTWTGLTNYQGRYVWSDGVDIYYSKGTTQYVLDKTDPANPAWVSMTWVDFTNFDGNNVWTDGTDIYYSYQSNHKKLTVATHTWTSMTWTGLTNYTGNKVWTDGTDVYYSSNATEYVLDIPNHNWVEKKWYGDTVSIDGSEIWSDGTDIHYANNSVSEKLVECSATDLIGVNNGIAELVNGRIPAENTNFVTAGLKSGVTRGTNATAEGYQTEPTGNYTHAEGYQCKATNNSAHAEGYQTQASTYSHSEGSGSKATGSSCHAEGNTTVASHNNSHAEGYYTQTGADYQHVQGKYNVGKATTLFEIGNGTNTSNRANAFEVESDGDVIAAGDITDGSGNKLSNKVDKEAGKGLFSGAYADLSGKPTLGTAAALNVASSGNASTTEVVKGDDTRLTDARNAADVSAWAKASAKPSYSDSEITNLGILQVLKPALTSSAVTYTMEQGQIYLIVGFEIGLNGYRAGLWIASYSNVNGENLGVVTKLHGVANTESYIEVSANGSTLTLNSGWANVWTVYKLVNNAPS